MSDLYDYDEIIERKILFYDLYKTYYNRNTIEINSINSLINTRDELIKIKYKVIPEIIYVNKKPVIKEFIDTSFKQKIIHHLTYFYLNDIQINEINKTEKDKLELLNILKGDIEFINISFNLLIDTKDIRILEYNIIYKTIENIFDCINFLETK